MRRKRKVKWALQIDYKGLVLLLMVGIIGWFTWNGIHNGEDRPGTSSNNVTVSMNDQP